MYPAVVSKNCLDIVAVMDTLRDISQANDELKRHPHDEPFVKSRLEGLVTSEHFKSVELNNEHYQQVGFAMGIVSDTWYSPVKNFYEMFVYIHPAYRSLSNARKLIRALEEEATAAGAEYIEVGASTQIREASVLKMYKLFGYTPHGGGMRKRLNV